MSRVVLSTRLLGPALTGLALALTPACTDEAFCFDCPEGSAGGSGGSTGAGGAGAGGVILPDGGGVPGSGAGINVGGASCGVPDNIAHCGECDHRCERFGMLAQCDTSGSAAVCRYECATGFVDTNGDKGAADGAASDGCDYECLETEGGNEICDGIDNDCDRQIDEGTSTSTDVNNCNACGNACALANAVPECVAGVCQVRDCLPGWHDVDRRLDVPEVAGCEYYCQPLGAEECNGLDDDCDGKIDDADDDVAVATDSRNCGRCGNNCEGQVLNAVARCEAGVCVKDRCLNGFFDDDPAIPGCEASCTNQNCTFPFAYALCDGQGGCSQGDCLPNYYDTDPLLPGCEYACEKTAPETERCDGKDNDCNGLTDADDPAVDTSDDPLNCGACGASCAGRFANSLAVCQGGVCQLSCLTGYVDGDQDGQSCEVNCGDCFFPNGTADDAACQSTGQCTFSGCLPGFEDTDPNLPGCEYQCTRTVPPTEACDGKDNDCDGQVDEDVTLTPAHCGACGLDCALFFPGSVTACVDVAGTPTCGFIECLPGFENSDGVTANGCEYPCNPTNGGVEACDGVDNDCDGVIDDVAAGTLPNACTGANDLGVGECDATTRCVQTAPGVFGPRCVRTKGPADEICDAKDNDCDGQTDENTVQSPLPGVGIPCGTARGACSLGSYACVSGALTCQGGTGPATETCNGADDDCDGLVDEVASSACGISTGACSTGTNQCVSGVTVCTGAVAAVAEVCDGNGASTDGFDNDCDGQVDEGCLRATAQPRRHDRGGVSGSTQSNTGQHSSFQLAAAAAGDDYLLAYSDGRNGNSTIFTAASTDAGTNWTARPDASLGDVTVASGGGARVEPHAFLRAGRGYVVYSRFGAFSGGDNVRRIAFSAAAAPYGTWGAEARVDATANNAALDLFDATGVVAKPAASGTTDFIAFVWNQIGGTAANPERDVFFRHSKDGGATFATAISPNGSDHQAELPVIASDGAGMVYVAYRSGGKRVAFRRINLNAATPAFEAVVFLQPNLPTIGAADLAIAADSSGRVHIAWTDLRAAKKTVRVASATNCGPSANEATCTGSFSQVASVTDGVIVSTGAVTDNASRPALAARAGGVVVAFEDTRSGASDIRVNRGVLSGSSFTWLAEPPRADVGDAPGSTSSTIPQVAYGQGSTVVVAWQDQRNPASSVLANVSLDGGATFYGGAGAYVLRADAFSNATAAAADSLTPVVLASPNQSRATVAYLDFHDGANAATLNGDVYTQLLQ